MPSSPARSGPRILLFWVGLGAFSSAQYLRVWPYPHWALNVVYFLWAVAAIALILGSRAMREANRGLTVPTIPQKLAQYRRQTALALSGASFMGALLVAPWLFEFIRLSPLTQMTFILLGWAMSMAILLALHRNRLAWVKLMSEPAD